MMTREYTNKILKAIDDGLFSYEIVLKELLSWLFEGEVEEFAMTSFGNKGMFPEENISIYDHIVKYIERAGITKEIFFSDYYAMADGENYDIEDDSLNINQFIEENGEDDIKEFLNMRGYEID